MRTNKRLMIYWILNVIKDDFNIKLNEKVIIIILTNITLMIINL